MEERLASVDLVLGRPLFCYGSCYKDLKPDLIFTVRAENRVGHRKIKSNVWEADLYYISFSTTSTLPIGMDLMRAIMFIFRFIVDAVTLEISSILGLLMLMLAPLPSAFSSKFPIFFGPIL